MTKHKRAFSEILRTLYRASKWDLTLAVFGTVGAKLFLTVGALITKLLIDYFVANSDTSSTLWILLLLGFLCAFGSVSLQSVATSKSNSLGLKVQHMLRLSVTEKVSKLDLRFFDDPNNHNLLLRVQGEVIQTPLLVTMALFQSINGFVSILSFITLLIALQPILLALLLVSAIPAVFAARYTSVDAFQVLSSTTPDVKAANYLDKLLTDTDTAKEVRLFALSDTLYHRLSYLAEKVLFNRLRLVGATARKFAMAEIFSSFATSCAIGYAAYRTATGDISIGNFTLLISAISIIQVGFFQILGNSSSIMEGIMVFSDYIRFSNLDPVIENSLPENGNLKTCSNRLTFSHVYFKYPGSPHFVIRDMSVEFEPGQAVAIVGENGAGKSTFVKLLTRLYDPTNGHIKLDGIDVKNLSIKKYRSTFGVLMQDFARYQFSLRENITIGSAEESFTGRLTLAAERANVTEIAQGLANGWDTLLGKLFDEQGQDLSGGQWQRVALARALYRDAPIVVLDEPSAAMDPKAESELLNAYRELIKGKTSILISHRLNMVALADRIICIREGEIVEDGTHNQLMELQGLYYKLFTAQSKSYAENSYRPNS